MSGIGHDRPLPFAERAPVAGIWLVWLSGLELGDDEGEVRLVRAGAGEMEADTPGVAGDDGADLEQPEADGPALGAHHPGAGEPYATDLVDQGTGERSQRQAELAVRSLP